MEAGRDNNMGLEGTWGGSLSCATCHVIFSAEDYVRVGEASDDEMDMLVARLQSAVDLALA